MIALLIAPDFDEATHYTKKWIQEVKKELVNQDYQLIYLTDEVKREKVENIIKVHNPDLIVFYNHGNEDAWYGSSTEKIIDLDNVDLLKNKEVYTLSCLSAKKLGVEAFKKGCKVFIGYKDVFSFNTDEEDLFKEAANSGIIKKIRDKVSWEEAFNFMKQKYNECIEKAQSFWTKTWLAWDRDCLVKYDENQPPETKCILRKMLLRILGIKALKLTRIFFAGLILFLVGYGVALHDFAHQVYELKGTVLSLEGGYVGFSLIMIGFLVMIYELWDYL